MCEEGLVTKGKYHQYLAIRQAALLVIVIGWSESCLLQMVLERCRKDKSEDSADHRVLRRKVGHGHEVRRKLKCFFSGRHSPET